MPGLLRAVSLLVLSISLLTARADDEQPQVELEVRIAEVNQQFFRSLGVDWRGTVLESADGPSEPALPSGTPGAGKLPDFTVLTPDGLSGVIRAIQQQQQIRVLSEPKITTSAGKPAIIDGTGPITYADRTFDEVGIRLQVTPTISQEGSVQMGVDVTSNELLPVQIPELTTRNAVTQVIIEDGETLVLGGLISEDQLDAADKIPQLGDLPLIGRLFRNSGNSGEKRNLMIFVTARLLGEDGQPVSGGGGGTASSGEGTATGSGNSNAGDAGATAGPGVAGNAAAAAGGGLSTGGGAPDECFGNGELGTTSLGPKPTNLGGIAKGIAGALLGGGGKSSSRTRTSKNPFKKAESFEHTTAEGAEFALQAQGAASKRKGPIDGTLFGIRLADDTVKKMNYLFTDVMLVDQDCNRHSPVERYVYKVWKKMRLTVTVSFWKWRDGQLVDHWTRSGSKEWTRLMGGGGGASPTWVGARFDVTPEQLADGGYTLVTACTVEQGGTVLVKGQGFDIAGSQETVSKIPGLSDLPTLGSLFRHSTGQQDDELLIFVTPRIATGPEQ